MECRRGQINPYTGLLYGECDCDSCEEYLRKAHIIEGCEIVLRAAIVQLLEASMMPDDIATLVRERAPKSSRAWMLTRIEVTCQAGYWLSNSAWARQLEQADRLSKHTGFQVGTTIPGWMQRWYMDKARYDEQVAVRSVRHVRTACAAELEASTPAAGAAHLDLAAGRPSSSCIVLPFRRRGR